jgi:hypothetical protein
MWHTAKAVQIEASVVFHVFAIQRRPAKMGLFAYVAKMIKTLETLSMSHHVVAWISTRFAARTRMSFIRLLL